MKKLKQKLGKRFTKLKRSPRFNQKNILLYVIAFAAIGTALLIISHAASPSANIEPEDGSGNALIGNDSSASGGQFVQFKAPSGTSNNAANRIIMYSSCPHILTASDADLDVWKSRGIGGFMCGFSKLYGMGGGEQWTGNSAALSSSGHNYQNQIKNTNIVGRIHNRGMKIYMGFDVVDYYSQNAPFGGDDAWMDDAWWNSTVIPGVTGFAGAAKLHGFDGLFVDQELIGCKLVVSYSDGRDGCGDWSWNYRGNTHTETQVRAKVKQRGQQLMTGILSQFPQVEMTAYDSRWPEDANALIQQVVNKQPATQQYETVNADFWDGLTSVDGYKAIRFFDATFYKTGHIGGFDEMIPYDQNRIFAWASQHFSNWDYLAPRFFRSPFIWISQNHGDPTKTPPNKGEPFSFYRGDQAVYDQLQTFRKWGMGGEFWNFSFDAIFPPDSGWNYSGPNPEYPAFTGYPGYPGNINNPSNVSGFKAASKPGIVDSTPPTLNITNPANGSTASSATAAVSGNTTDNMAIHYVTWSSNRGGSGFAKMTWRTLSCNCSKPYSWEWQLDWSASIPLQTGTNVITITSFDIKDLNTTKTITINR